MGITGTCEGYFENPLYVYNYGTWKYVSSGGMSTTSITGKETMVEMYMYTNSSNIQFYGVTLQILSYCPDLLLSLIMSE